MSDTNGFERIVKVTPAFDRRHRDPAKNYGVGAMRIMFILKGERGAMQFVIGTNWYPQHVQVEREGKSFPFDAPQPRGWDIGYHSPTPQYEGQEPLTDSCEFTNGAPCYYDGSSLQAEDFIPAFLDGGSDAVWTMLERRYREIFDHAGAVA